MKKIISFIMVALLALSLSVVSFAEETADVFVKLTDETNSLVLVYMPVTVTDSDGDGILSVNDALFAAHEKYYDGGAAAGYGSAPSDFGMSLSKLWGFDGGNAFGYYVNNVSSMSLLDPVKTGDNVAAFVYTDMVGWSDTFSFFDVNTATANAGEPLSLTLSAAGFDANWSPVTLPVADASVLVDGVAAATTDADGKVSLTFAKAGTYTISAVSDTQTLVAPSCVVIVSEANPKTADDFTIIYMILIALSIAVIAFFTLRKKQTKGK